MRRRDDSTSDMGWEAGGWDKDIGSLKVKRSGEDGANHEGAGRG